VPRRGLEAGEPGFADVADRVAAGGDGGAAVLRAERDESAPAEVVRDRASARGGLPALRALERRLAAGAGQLPVLRRDPSHAQSPGRVVGGGTGGLRGLLRPVRGSGVEIERRQERGRRVRVFAAARNTRPSRPRSYSG